MSTQNAESVRAEAESYDEGFAAGRRFFEMEKRGWNPGNTYLALMTMHGEQWVAGFEAGLIPAQNDRSSLDKG